MSALLDSAGGRLLIDRFGHAETTQALKAESERLRLSIREGHAESPTTAMILAAAAMLLKAREGRSLRPVFNLTGVVIHTNLGRSLIAEAAVAAAVDAMRMPSALEFDLESGGRGERDDHIRGLLCELTGAEDATVVNNNAAAVLLCLNSLALNKEAIISRGELIEIGGAFRMPDIMARAGARMVEVGTTNRTHPRDYRSAIGSDTGLILKVHTSNYRVQGFTAEVAAPELAQIAHDAGIALVNDMGSGSLIDMSGFGLHREPTVREAVAEGAGLVTFSGDKLLGGPQAGFIVGHRDLIAQVNRNPMKRALRVDKIRLAVIEATLKLYRHSERLAGTLPTLRDLARTRAEIRAQAEAMAPVVARAVGPGFGVEVVECSSQVGSGAQPTETLPSAGLAIAPAGGGGRRLEELAAALRALERPVIGRLAEGRLLLDLRCLADAPAFEQALASLRSGQVAGA